MIAAGHLRVGVAVGGKAAPHLARIRPGACSLGRSRVQRGVLHRDPCRRRQQLAIDLRQGPGALPVVAEAVQPRQLPRTDIVVALRLIGTRMVGIRASNCCVSGISEVCACVAAAFLVVSDGIEVQALLRSSASASAALAAVTDKHGSRQGRRRR